MKAVGADRGFATLEREVLEALARGAPTRDVLARLVQGLEELAVPGALGSILLVDDQCLRNGAAPSLAEEYVDAIDGEPIGPAQGSCGTAAWRRETVVVVDIEKDPLWAGYKDVALAYGLRSCWSVPIFATTGDVVGTFAFYHREPLAPTVHDLAFIERAASLARLVLERWRSELERRRAAERTNACFAAARVLAEAGEVGGTLHDLVRAVAGALGWSLGAVWLQEDGGDLVCRAHWSSDPSFDEFIADTKSHRFAPGDGMPGRVLRSGQPEWHRIQAQDPDFRRWPAATRVGLCTAFALPIAHENQVFGAIELFSTRSQRADPELLEALMTVGLQTGQFLQRTRAQEERERLVGELRQALGFSELFAGILAHDLRNPLNAIVLGTELLLAKVDDANTRTTLMRMRESERRMTRMIEQLLDVTRARSGQGLVVRRAPSDLAELSDAVVNELRMAYPHRELKLDVEGDATGEWDVDRLAQVLSNLIGNALEHGSDGEVTVRVDGRARDAVELATYNRGSIPPERVNVLFDPFERATSHRTSSGGLGLGLYITKLIVTAHGGEVHVESHERGTTFGVRLPRVNA